MKPRPTTLTERLTRRFRRAPHPDADSSPDWPTQPPAFTAARQLAKSGWRLALPLLALLLLIPLGLWAWGQLARPAADAATDPTPFIPALGAAIATAAPQPLTPVRFRVQVPADTPPDDPILLTLLDEVTGLALNAQPFPMTLDASDPSGQFRLLELPFPVGSLVRYRYERQGAAGRLVEHASNDAAIRYRLMQVGGPGAVNDTIARWTDTPFAGPTGRIYGRAFDRASGRPLPNLLVTAGGEQTLTRADGAFLLEGLAPGVHTLVAIAFDSSYRPFQQEAQVAAAASTPAELQLDAAPLVSVVFVVTLPANTPPQVPVRLAGSLVQTGNTFADLAGGISTLAANMPVLTPLPDGRSTLTLSLPAGADLRYKYTLGDGFWNAEHRADGSFELRQIIVPSTNLMVVDEVITWQDSAHAPLSFTVQVPENTPLEDSVAIQFNPRFGWTEPLPLWALGKDRWGYLLYSPLNLPGDTLNYRYCRNGQCDLADAVETAGPDSLGMVVRLGAPEDASRIITRQDVVSAWQGLATPLGEPSAPPEAAWRGEEFMAGVEFTPAFRPSWRVRLPNTLGQVQSLHADWLVLTPTWTWTRRSPAVLEPVVGADPLLYDLQTYIDQSRMRSLNVALFPTPRFPSAAAAWWQAAPRDPAWWDEFFAQYRAFALHHAEIAQRTGAQTLILGGDWLLPALTDGQLADGSPSAAPADADARLRALLNETRTHFAGRLLWAMPLGEYGVYPSFIDAVDGIYLLFAPPLAADDPASRDLAALGAAAGDTLDGYVSPLINATGKPVVLAVAYPAATGVLSGCVPLPSGGCASLTELAAAGTQLAGVDLDLEAQDLAYQAVLTAVNERPWLSGLVSRGYYPPAALQDLSASVHGKPASVTLASWFSQFVQAP